MANGSVGPGYRIDTFGADVTIATGMLRVTGILVNAFTSTKTVAFIDSDGASILKLEATADASSQLIVPMKFDNGLIFDESASDLAAGDSIYIFFE